MQHPITPPPELAAEWFAEICGEPVIPLNPITLKLVERAAQWGWDQRGEVNEAELQKARDVELEACVEWLIKMQNPCWATALQEGRRPKAPSLKEQALKKLAWVDEHLNMPLHNQCDAVIAIRRALEALPDD